MDYSRPLKSLIVWCDGPDGTEVEEYKKAPVFYAIEGSFIIIQEGKTTDSHYTRTIYSASKVWKVYEGGKI